MPRPQHETLLKVVCSVSELARRCALSRSRWYELVRDGVMPHPVYCTRTRRPLYTRELQELALRVRQTNTGIDGRYVAFYEQPAALEGRQRAPRATQRLPTRRDDRQVVEMIDALRTLLPRQSDEQIRVCIDECYPAGVPEGRFEEAVTTVFRLLRRSNRG